MIFFANNNYFTTYPVCCETIPNPTAMTAVIGDGA